MNNKTKTLKPAGYGKPLTLGALQIRNTGGRLLLICEASAMIKHVSTTQGAAT